MTVNLAAAQLGHDDFVPDVVDILRATGLPASRLVLEMTETVMFHDSHTTIARLTELRDLGVRVAIDDFGTGYSSLGYLRRFPVDILKIAKEFVVPDGSGPDGWAFASAIVALGRTLGLRIVAEGIEEQGQLDVLRDLGCELGQGFLFARPMPGEEIARVFAGASPRPVDARDLRAAPEARGEDGLMFILYSVVIGLVVGFLAGGSTTGLASLRIRWPGAIVVGLLVQVALFTDLAAQRVGDLGPILYVGVDHPRAGRDRPEPAIPGMPVVIAGAACNLAAIIANGGYMPAAAGRPWRPSGRPSRPIYSNSSAAPDPVLWPLTDIFALPRWLPWANIFSLGDVVIGVGVVLVIVLAMRRPCGRRSSGRGGGRIPGPRTGARRPGARTWPRPADPAARARGWCTRALTRTTGGG